MAKILIADDRQLMRSALRTTFAMRPKWEICGEATDGREAVTKEFSSRPASSAKAFCREAARKICSF